MLPVRPNDRSTSAAQLPYSCKAKASSQHPSNDRTSLALLPLSLREQQVFTHRNEGFTYEAIARHLSCSPAAAKAYHRRALSKRQRTTALASLEPNDRKPTAQPEPAVAKVPRDRPASALASVCERNLSGLYDDWVSGLKGIPAYQSWKLHVCSDASSAEQKLRTKSSPFHSPAVDALAFRERPNAIDLCIPSLFVEGESVTDLSSGYIDVRTCQINLLKIPESLQSLERLPDQSKALEGDESAKGWDFVGRKLSFAPRVRTQSTHSPQTTITDRLPTPPPTH